MRRSAGESEPPQRILAEYAQGDLAILSYAAQGPVRALGALVGVGLVGPFLWAAFNPDWNASALKLAGAGLAVPFIAAWLGKGRVKEAARTARWTVLPALLMALVFVPKMLWMAHTEHCGMNELSIARERVEAYTKEHAHAPRDLAELPVMPELRIWTVDESGEEHLHARTRAVSLVNDGVPPDTGGWGYDAAAGRVFISCTGLEPKLRRNKLFTR
jgi:hypothetical protein